MNLLCLTLGHRWRWMRCERCGQWRTRPGATPAVKPTRMVHQLKIWPQYYAAVATGAKTFEVRRNDRNYGAGDHIILCAWDPIRQRYTGDRTTVLITYVLPGGQHGVEEGHVVLAIRALHSTSGFSGLQTPTTNHKTQA